MSRSGSTPANKNDERTKQNGSMKLPENLSKAVLHPGEATVSNFFWFVVSSFFSQIAQQKMLFFEHGKGGTTMKHLLFVLKTAYFPLLANPQCTSQEQNESELKNCTDFDKLFSVQRKLSNFSGSS